MPKHQDDLRDLDWSMVFGNSEHFRGTPGDDRLVGTDGRDKFHIEQGGNDIVKGLDGNDFIYAGASLTPDDRIDGGVGKDKLVLEGDYSNGLTLQSHTISQIEEIDLRGNFDYSITMAPHMRHDMDSFVVDASDSHSLHLDGSTMDLNIVVLGSYGDDIVAGGSGLNEIIPGGGHDVMIGGTGLNEYFFYSTSDSIPTNGDVVTNFNKNGDSISLRDIDADPHKKGYQEFHLGATPNHVGDVTLTYDAAHDVTMVNVFTDKDTNPDMVIQLLGNHTDLTEANFVL